MTSADGKDERQKFKISCMHTHSKDLQHGLLLEHKLHDALLITLEETTSDLRYLPHIGSCKRKKLVFSLQN